MLSGKRVLIVGGDARQLEIARTLVERDALVYLAGYANLHAPLAGTQLIDWTPEGLGRFHAVILPAKGIGEDGTVDSLFNPRPIVMNDAHFRALFGAVLYTGIAGAYLRERAARFGLPLVVLFDRDDVAILNAVPTAEGAIMFAIQHTDITLHQSHTAVVGFGRVGMTLAPRLKALGSNVTVFARQSEALARAYEMGLIAYDIGELKRRIGDADAVFNTVPAPVVTAEVIAAMKPSAFILDLASHPGGTDFHFAEKRGIRAMLAPSLPGLVAPKTAGRILADVLTKLIGAQQHENGERSR
ncbi:MAG: dipicolinate synthase subunit DpsA [Hydrogenibacillus sp.]|nr:dipicolinate synthase subunit DpsA [Hydrogenibacillus sp.]